MTDKESDELIGNSAATQDTKVCKTATCLLLQSAVLHTFVSYVAALFQLAHLTLYPSFPLLSYSV